MKPIYIYERERERERERETKTKTNLLHKKLSWEVRGRKVGFFLFVGGIWQWKEMHSKERKN